MGLLGGRAGASSDAAVVAGTTLANARAADATFEDGIVAFDAGNYAAALRCFEAVIAARHDDAAAHNYLGLVHLKQGNLEDAVDCFVLSTHYRPVFSEAHYNLAFVAQRRGEHREAIAHLKRAISCRADYAEAYNALGASEVELRNPQQAVAHYQEAVALKPDYADAHSNLGHALISAFGDYERGAAHIKTALDLDDSNPNAWCNYGLVLWHQGRLDDMISVCDQLLTKIPTWHRARYLRAHANLGLGRLSEGWADYEARKQVLPTFKVRKFPYREWDGSPLARGSLLVYNEQGIGDEILFASCLPDLLALGGQCFVECSQKLEPLFRRSFPGATIHVADQALADMSYLKALPQFDWQVAAGSLPRHFRRGLGDFPARGSFLVADPLRVAYWRERFAGFGVGLKVGFCWRSSALKGGRAFEYSSLSQWGPIFAMPGVHFVNLQYDECLNELDQARNEFGVTLHHFSEVDMFNDLDETAGLMKALDLVISAQTAVSAQAGALGVPCWQMTSGTDWTILGTENNPWFPTMKRFPRRWEQPWSEIMARIAGELHSIALAHHRRTVVG